MCKKPDRMTWTQWAIVLLGLGLLVGNCFPVLRIFGTDDNVYQVYQYRVYTLRGLEFSKGNLLLTVVFLTAPLVSSLLCNAQRSGPFWSCLLLAMPLCGMACGFGAIYAVLNALPDVWTLPKPTILGAVLCGCWVLLEIAAVCHVQGIGKWEKPAAALED